VIVADASCVFCEILGGNAPASVVYANGQAMAFMDIQPVNPGHLLVIPQVHAADLASMDPEIGGELFRLGMELAQALQGSGIRCEGVNLFLADGAAAGQEVFHVHLHVIPRFKGDGFGFRFGSDYNRPPDRDQLDQAAAAIRQGLLSSG
jgi:histidine triad (HIT) family protein